MASDGHSSIDADEREGDFNMNTQAANDQMQSSVETAAPKIMHIVEAYGGGVQTALEQYIGNSAFAEHRIVARSRPGHDVGVLKNAHVDSYDGSLRSFIKYCGRQIRELNPDVIHLHSSYASLARLVISRKTAARVLYTPHCYAFERQDKNQFERIMYRAAEYSLEKICPVEVAAVSPFEAARARDMVRAKKVRILPNVVNTRESWTYSHANSINSRTVVGIGRISSQKDPDFFAHVASLLRSANIKFMWIGNGDTSLRSALEEAGVRVTGWLPNSRVRELVASASLYLHTARWEGAPIAPLEATELGIPVLIRDVPTMRGLGYFSAGSCVEDVAESVRKFFELEDFRDSVYRTDSERISAWTPKHQNDVLKQLYARDPEGRRSYEGTISSEDRR